MSINNEGHKAIRLSAAQEDLACLDLGINEHQKFEISVLRFVFQQVAADSNSYKPSIVSNKIAASNTVEEVGIRYALYKEFYEEFFKAGHKDKALLLAVFCNSRIHDVNAPLPNENGDLEFSERHFEEDDVLDAVRIWDEAYNLEHFGIAELDTPLLEESIFLAHILAIEYLDEIGNSLDETPFGSYLPHEIQEIQEIHKYLKNISSIIKIDTDIGQRLEMYVSGIEAELYSACPYLETCTERNIPYPANDMF